ncbi:MAG: TonB-dependent receptor plug domain-containing protein, partial [Rubrivivax sp.]|nr:TonB-dependent receptor plug domain-containing protein [Rubrivivax sp.]
MKNTLAQRQFGRALLRATPVAAAVATLWAVPGAGSAQTSTAAPPAQVITVTGIRRGIESAINVKKNSDAIVEAVSAEDIGKLPDNSIAESLARLPGVTAQRVAGKAQNINIRGLSGDFANALLNGREQTSTGDNRAVEFDQYPSELLSAVVVYKTPTASLLGQGLSGTLDLQTIRPLSFGQRTIALNVRGEKTGVGTAFEGDGSRISFSYIDQFANRTIGVAFGFARLKQKGGDQLRENYDTANRGELLPDGRVIDRNDNAADLGQNIVWNQGFKLFNNDRDETRDGAVATFEYKPNKNFSTKVDLFYSKFERDFVKRGLEIQVGDTWKACCDNLAFQRPTLSNAVIEPGTGRVISGTWGGVNPLSRTIWEPRRDELTSAGWEARFKPSQAWTIVGDLNYS